MVVFDTKQHEDVTKRTIVDILQPVSRVDGPEIGHNNPLLRQVGTLAPGVLLLLPWASCALILLSSIPQKATAEQRHRATAVLLRTVQQRKIDFLSKNNSL